MSGRSAGLDIGDRRIGVAVSDPLGITAQPLGVVERRSRTADVSAIMDLLREYPIVEFVAGLPLNMDGTEGTQADRVRHFCTALQADTGLPVVFTDERLSSVEARRALAQASGGGRRGRAKRKAKLDATASAIILQTHLDQRTATRGR